MFDRPLGLYIIQDAIAAVVVAVIMLWFIAVVNDVVVAVVMIWFMVVVNDVIVAVVMIWISIKSTM